MATSNQVLSEPAGVMLEDAGAALAFMLAGNATVTIKSRASGTRFTYRIRRAEERDDLYFVSLLTGTDNQGDYTYLGVIGGGRFRLTAKSRLRPDSTPVVAFDFTLQQLQTGHIPNVEIWHEGRCGRCGRALTVPESIASGIGPECIKKVEAEGRVPVEDEGTYTPDKERASLARLRRQQQLAHSKEHVQTAGARVQCERCGGTGKFITYVENGQPKGPGGECFRCGGKGYQDEADRRRNWGYDNYGVRA